jgi:UDP-N-acetylglucosamine diphosphorylase/glucosamine-1-phosphate N-acetyltransferase
VNYICEDYLQKVYKKHISEENTLFINSCVLPDAELVTELLQLNEGESLTKNSTLIAYRRKFGALVQNYDAREYNGTPVLIKKMVDVLSAQKSEITNDYFVLTKGRHSNRISDSYSTLYGKDIFIEEGAIIKSSILNAEDGPIYIGKNCKIEEGSIIQGPFGMLDRSVVAMGARIRPGVSLGPKCIIGGEVKNTVFQSFSNKAHDGYIGDSLIGSWCNIGAGTTSSNLKNNWSHIRIWDQEAGKENDTGRQKLGLIMGDYCMVAIGTLFNTGSVIGVGCSLFNHSFTTKHLASFSWGDDEVYIFKEFVKSIEQMKSSKKEIFKDEEVELLMHVYSKTIV